MVDGFGAITWWGFSPALDLQEKYLCKLCFSWFRTSRIAKYLFCHGDHKGPKRYVTSWRSVS